MIEKQQLQQQQGTGGLGMLAGQELGASCLAQDARPGPEPSLRTPQRCWPLTPCPLSLTPANCAAPDSPHNTYAYRDVYLLLKPRRHISDFHIRTPLRFDASGALASARWAA